MALIGLVVGLGAALGAALAAGAAGPAYAQAAAGSGSGPPLWVFLVIGAVFVGVIALVGAFAFRTMRAARASRAWPVTEGRVLSGDVQTVEERDRDGDRTTYYVPRLRYAYEVDGRRFEGERIRFGSIRESEAGARKILARYAVGSSVPVRHDPANPAEATLETKAGGIGVMLFALVLLTALFAYMASVFLG